MIQFEQWEGFEGRIWKEEVNVRDFIQKNYTPYDGDESFLAGPTEATDKLWGALQQLQKAERAKGGVLDMETEVVMKRSAHRRCASRSNCATVSRQRDTASRSTPPPISSLSSSKTAGCPNSAARSHTAL